MSKATVRIIPTRRDDGSYFATWSLEHESGCDHAPDGCEAATENEAIQRAKEQAIASARNSLLKGATLEFIILRG
jgi:hypothetical protein